MSRKVVFACDGPGCDLTEETQGKAPGQLAEGTVVVLGNQIWHGHLCRSCGVKLGKVIEQQLQGGWNKT